VLDRIFHVFIYYCSLNTKGMSHLKIIHLPANRQVERSKPQHTWEGSIHEHWLPSFSRYTALISTHVPYYYVLKMAVIFFLETLANLCQTTPNYTPEYGNQDVFFRRNYFMRLCALDSTCNSTNNSYFFLPPKNVSAGLFRTCLRL
jgi:hypothetical protein